MTAQLDSSVHQRFSSGWGLLLSVLGIAIGTGNIWRFPRIAAQNSGDQGAGAFLIAWVAFLFLWSIPLIIAEYALGRKYRTGVVKTISRVVGKKFTWMGGFIAFVSTAITFFYSVIVGWCIFYFIHSLIHPLPAFTPGAGATAEEITAASKAIWDTFQNSNWPMLFHAIAMGFGALAIWKGVSSIERVNKVLIPTLLGIVILAVIRALTLPGAGEGVSYLFTPQWSQLGQPKVWLEALTQNAWDTGAGWGLFLTYAAYMRREHGVVKNAFTTAIGNNMVSLLAALMIFGTAFAIMQSTMGMDQSAILKAMKESGEASTGLTFIWMPQLFANMPMGRPLCALFFLGLTFAGFSSLIAQLELPTRVLVDTGLKRSRAIGLVVASVYLLGIPSAKYLKFLTNQDHVWGIALMISGAFVAFTIIRYGARKLRTVEILQDPNDWNLRRWWEWIMKFFVPIAATVLLIWWLIRSATEYSGGQWYNPLKPYSIMSCLVQWGIILAILILLNHWIFDRLHRSDHNNQKNRP
jgi:NSS family neurotransmitter:Na+ symporter